MKHGPLAGFKVLEFAGIGPGPMCGMLLADLGADVLRLDRAVPTGLGVQKPTRFDLLNRGKRVLAVDLKHADGIALARRLVSKADATIEGLRPGAMERLGLGPDDCFGLNPRVVYGRVTGFGQEGPMSLAAGHDLNYIAMSGALHAIGRKGAAPTPPLNLVGDFGGGGLMLAFGIVSALLEASRSGKGQVVDTAMVDGAATLMASFFGGLGAGQHNGIRGDNLLDSGAPHYEVYECADGEYITIAPIEMKFREVLFERLGLPVDRVTDLDDRRQWPAYKQRFTEIFKSKPSAHWCALLEGTDACFAPVLSPAAAQAHPHNKARATFIEVDGVLQPAPAPRFSRTPADVPTAPVPPGASGVAAAGEWGVAKADLQALIERGVVVERAS
ncbi:MAG TPA: CaiB/BaiF CoA-transferase family protein [Burkholderiaceae bacterium]|jgi:alpha-methylacyl-CoA racemase|nr:CaiB/BaiF CoA-transferase family protein [Burkholderiaceae bacterium]